MNGIEDLMRVLTESVEIIPESAPTKPVCPICRGVGYYRRWRGDPGVSCACRDERLRQKRYQQLRESSGAKDVQRWTFANYDESRHPAAFKAAWDLLEGRAAKPWLFLYGENRVGKTHLAASMLNWRLEHGLEALFLSAFSFFGSLKATFRTGTTEEVLGLYEDAEFLVFDDLGKQRGDWAESEALRIINTRYNRATPTVLTSNKKISELEKTMGGRIADLAVMVPLK